MKVNRLFILIISIISIGCFSCSLDYEEARVAEEISEETPETIIINFTHTIVSNGKVSVILEAERAETFEGKKQIHLQGIHYREYGEDETLVAEGWTDRAVFYTDTEAADVSGSVKIYSAEEETALYAESLSWTKEGKRLEAEPGDIVILKKDNGTYIEGRGFKADFRRRQLKFNKVRGVYVWEEED